LRLGFLPDRENSFRVRRFAVGLFLGTGLIDCLASSLGFPCLRAVGLAGKLLDHLIGFTLGTSRYDKQQRRSDQHDRAAHTRTTEHDFLQDVTRSRLGATHFYCRGPGGGN